MDRWKSRGGKSQRRERKKKENQRREREKRKEEERRSEKRKSKKKEYAGVRKGRKVAKHCVFPMIWGSGGSKSRLAKAAGAEPSGKMRDEKLHALVVRSRFWSEDAKDTSLSEHFWKLRCWKSAPPWREARLEVKTRLALQLGAHLEVEMFKKCTPLWREARFQVKMVKTRHVRTTFGSWDVERVHAVVAWGTFASQTY